MKGLHALGMVLVVAGLATAQTPDQKKQTVDYLHGLQVKEGGYRASPSAKEPSLRATSSALRAIKYFGGTPKDKERSLAFVQSCFDKKSGGFADTPGGKPDVVLTAVGLMALVELKAPREGVETAALDYLTANARGFEQVRMAAAGLEAIGKKSPKNAAWLAEITGTQNSDGTFGKRDGLARDTGGAVAAVLRLGGEFKNPEAIIKALDAAQLKGGGFGKTGSKEADLETSYRVLRTYHMLKAKPSKADALKEFVARCRNADGGYCVAPGEPSSVGGTYFAGIILHWLDEK